MKVAPSHPLPSTGLSNPSRSVVSRSFYPLSQKIQVIQANAFQHTGRAWRGSPTSRIVRWTRLVLVVLVSFNSDSETGTRTREANLVTRMGAQSSPTCNLNDWGRHCGSQNVEFPWRQNSARGAALKLVTLLLLALRKLPRKRSQKRSRKSYVLPANPVPCSCPNVLAARLDQKLARSLLRHGSTLQNLPFPQTGHVS